MRPMAGMALVWMSATAVALGAAQDRAVPTSPPPRLVIPPLTTWTEPPPKRVGPLTLLPAGRDGEFIRVGLPIGDLASKAAGAVASARRRRAERKAKADVQKIVSDAPWRR